MEEIFLRKNNQVKSKNVVLSGRKRSETHRLQADLSASRVQISPPRVFQLIQALKNFNKKMWFEWWNLKQKGMK